MTELSLVLSTPLKMIAQADALVRVEAEDQTGRFAIAPGHADFITILVPTVLAWRDNIGTSHYAAVSDAVMIVDGGKVSVMAREAFAGDNPADLLGRIRHERATIQNDARIAAQKAAALDDAARRHIASLSRGAS